MDSRVRGNDLGIGTQFALENPVLGIVYSAGLFSLNASLIKVEVDVASGFPGWTMVGLPEKGVQEAKERVTAGLRNSGIQIESRKTTINLAPATQKKSGNQYDLPIAIGLLLAHGVLPRERVAPFLFAGELSLTGELRPVRGAIFFATLARQKGFRALVCPKENVWEARLVREIEVIGCETIAEVYQFIEKGILPPAGAPPPVKTDKKEPPKDFAEVKGQALAKRGLEISAAGNHHLLMIGPPGTGKTMLAGRYPSILPELTPRQSLEITKIYSAIGQLDFHQPLIRIPPFRAPHHSASYASLIGGIESMVVPGEVTLAHHGVLFLDELPEFRRDTLQVLRQPLECGHILISRARGRARLPAKFLLLSAMNPCKCGYLGHPRRNCLCDPGNVLRYRGKISGPLLDRIDLHAEVLPLGEKELFAETPSESSADIAQRVRGARERQRSRYESSPFQTNAELYPSAFKQYCRISSDGTKFLRAILTNLQLSARAFDRIIKVGRTIADLAGHEVIQTEHIAEAATFRLLDREPFS